MQNVMHTCIDAEIYCVTGTTGTGLVPRRIYVAYAYAIMLMDRSGYETTYISYVNRSGFFSSSSQ